MHTICDMDVVYQNFVSKTVNSDKFARIARTCTKNFQTNFNVGLQVIKNTKHF